MFSIIISTYNQKQYLKECLDSITNQSYQEYEILLGIDYCPETLEYIKNIGNNYKNLRIFYAKENVGPYVVKNTLINVAKHNNIIFFDSDDVMKPYMLEEIYKHIDHFDVIRLGYVTFKKELKSIDNQIHRNGDGVFFVKKDKFNKVGGFRNWRCGADTEFRSRTRRFFRVKTLISKPMFWRRYHPYSLSNDPSTNMKSKLRKSYKTQVIRPHTLSEAYIKPEMVPFEEIVL